MRWQRDIEHVRQLPPSTDLRRLFFYRLNRRVRRDGTFLLGRRFYEVPTHLVGRTIEVRFDPLQPAEVDIYSDGQLAGSARPVDAVLNSQLPRPERQPTSTAEASGINFIDLLVDAHQRNKED